ncbi:MAG TPA: SH3 domain-containing protein [Acidobacteriota bacterium]|nr:SH3 domain-containing protein [Acidobacteriota bacterium]
MNRETFDKRQIKSRISCKGGKGRSIALTALTMVSAILLALLFEAGPYSGFSVGKGILLAQNTAEKANRSSEPLPSQEKDKSFPREWRINVPIGNIRKSPNTSSPIVEKLGSGAKVTLIQQQGEWYAVRLPDNRSGWAHESLFYGRSESQVTAALRSKEIKELKVDLTSESEERVIIVLNGFYPPQMFSLEGERPRIVCDFPDARLGDGIVHYIDVNGKFIQLVRVAVHRGANPKVRIVLDLLPHQNYDVQQIFLKEQCLYTIIVRRLGSPDNL